MGPLDIHELIKHLVLPPSLILWLLLFGLICWRKRGLALGLTLAAWLLLFSLSLPIVAYYLALPLQQAYPVLTTAPPQEQHAAIVVLSGGTSEQAAEYHLQPWPSDSTLQRLTYAAYLYQHSHLPILASGGSPSLHAVPEAQTIKNTLEKLFNTPVKWLETHSKNTYENAEFSSKILKANGIKKIYLVTHAEHMPRAMLAFENSGLVVIPAPMGFVTLNSTTQLWIPNFNALFTSSYAAYEYFGLLWYWLHYQD